MHFVDRGTEPDGLKKRRDNYTSKWEEYYTGRTGAKPSDDYWREFTEDLGQAFFSLCGYCEAECKGEVDHFRPKSRFPSRVYEWSNWVFACHDCNHSKGEKWPKSGYVDPCARIRSSRPEQYFDFDLKTGEILPKAGLTQRRRQRARAMIDDLKLNAFHHLKRRRTWIGAVARVLAGDDRNDPDHEEFVRNVSARDYPLSSITRAFLTEEGYRVGEI